MYLPKASRFDLTFDELIITIDMNMKIHIYNLYELLVLELIDWSLGIMIQERQQGGGGAPHAILLAVVVAIVVIVPFLVGDQGEAITEAISELLSPLGLLLLPILLLLTIQFLSSDRGSFISALFSTGEPDTIHRVSGSPVGVALFLLLLLILLYNRVSIFGGDDSDE
ncbi:hypothetical protein VNO77_05716 [Canavalia gladiata]|uniref:Uncharacterized protein n=1 Tax=Canavalia gladiata TaxID=3824 RepID=A0AAN9MYV6_CANGL